MFFKSTGFKIIALYIVMLVITLSSFSLLIYGNFSKDIYDHLDDLLSSKAEGVATAYSTYYQIKKIEAAQHGKEFNSMASEEPDDFVKVAHSWVEQQRKDPELMSIFVQLIRPDGDIVVSSKAAPQMSHLPKDDFKDILDGEDSFDTVDAVSSDGKKIKLRLYSKPIIEEGKAVYIVQAAGPIGMISIALSSLRFILFVLLPLMVLLAGLPGIFLVRVALRPIDKMIGTLKHITAENLKLKIHIPDTKDELSRLADTFNDMIERLDRSFSSQQDFTRNILRELEVPVDALRKDIEDALRSARSAEEYKAAFQGALKEIGAFSEIVDDLRAITHQEDGRLLLEIKKVNLSDIIEGELNAVKASAEEKDIDVSFYCKETIVTDGDEKQLRKLFANILDNAVKYTYRRGKVVVTAKREREVAKVTISDTGAGMPEDEIPYIFDRFYQVNRSRKSRNGFGLGLSIARAIVEAHKGNISAKSQIGQGSSFTVCLPLSYPV